MAHPCELERVSEDLRTLLSEEASKPAADKRDAVADLMNSERFAASYEACVWWDGCYYCQDAKGDWYCIRCGFF